MTNKVEDSQPIRQPRIVEIEELGGSLAIILTDDILAHLESRRGDRLCLALMPGGGLHITRGDSISPDAMDVARRGMARYRNALAKLAE